MNRVYLTGLALGVLITGYFVLDRSTQEPSIIKTEYAAESNIPSTEKAQSSKLNTNIDNTQTSQLDSSPTETEAQEVDLAYQYQAAVREFEVLTPSEQLQKRKLSLSKVIAGEKTSINDEVALQQDWERAGTAEPGYQHKKESYSTVDVNGLAVETGKPGIIIEDSVMVYIPVSKSSFVAELNAVSGIENIEQVFKTTKTLKTSGVRDPAGWHRIDLSAPASRIKSIARALKSFSDVTEAEPVYERKLSIVEPLVSELNDPKMVDQWHLGASKVNEAWEYLEANSLPAGGDNSIVVAVIDTGVDYDHPDLIENMWVNTQEIPGNGVDDDNNGFVDDVHGVSVVSESYSHTGDPDDDNGHGTHVAGIIASTGANGVGGVGVAYNSKIMAIKAAQYSGVLTTADIAEAVYYALDNGADVINMSFGGYGRSQVEEDALANAYSQAVLIAAAGNDGIPNQPCPFIGAPMYPAAHPWVVGVMASTSAGTRAGFSNSECIPKNGLEYELLAPGVAIWSTLPDGSYSAWSGTSMAAPVASGIAALARTRYPDKSTYSSRFIMGQLLATDNGVANALASVSTVPEPDLAYEEHWLFDDTTTSRLNDNDGRVDAGETVELAVVIRNRWGRADNVVATLSTPSGDSTADPYVTLQTASVDYGAVGSFNKDDNGIEYDEGLLVTGVRNPFVFSVDANTPNNHIIPITITMTAENGLDPDDETNYSFTSTFELAVQRGRELPSIIDGDMLGTDGGNIDTDGVENGIVTLDSSALWIIDKPVQVASGTTLKITEDAQVQFWSSAPDAAQQAWKASYLQVEGILDIAGSAMKPVLMFPSSLYPQRSVSLYTKNDGAILLNYSKIKNVVSWGNFTKVDSNLFERDYRGLRIFYAFENGVDCLYSIEDIILPGTFASLRFNCGRYGASKTWDGNIHNYRGNKIYKTTYQNPYPNSSGYIAPKDWEFSPYIPAGYNESLIDGLGLEVKLPISNSVFLKNVSKYINNYGETSYTNTVFKWAKLSNDLDIYAFENNAVLNTWKNPDIDFWGVFQASLKENVSELDISGSFWGGASDTVAAIAINDTNDDFNLGLLKFQPTLESGAETTYPFVTKFELMDGEGTVSTNQKFGAQSSRWRITFNRDMDIAKQPLVTFGPTEPFTDFSVPGDWLNTRVWEGDFRFSPLAGDGIQQIRVTGAVAADNAWLVTGDDSERFSFELITSGAEALSLQANGGEDNVSLSWMQDDFELLHGYNLYRSLSEDGTYTRINSSTIDKSITSFLDSDVAPGVGHYYYFTVVSDGGESSPSNIALATPTDTIDPVITHLSESVVTEGDSLTLRATVTDNIVLTEVNIVYRNASGSAWQTRAMIKTDTVSRYSITLTGADIGNQYLEYYIEAKDGVNTVTSGSVESPYKVFVSLPSDTDTDGDGVNNADDAFPYDPSETTDLDGDGIGDNADLDDDGDNYNDDVDVFPRDASEWIDTDGDGIGNNRDTDDDNDGVEDGADQFPLDVRGSKDSDNDGMPDQWETDNGLDPNDASDAESDTDFDGFTALQEFEADTSPLVSDQNTQIIYHEFSPFVAGFSNNVKVFYRPSDGVSGLTGLGLRVHYNSQLVEPLVIENILLLDLVSLGTEAMPDAADFDNDPSTDSFINIAWAATSGSSWPGESPVKLFDMKVKFSDLVTADSTINIKFTSSSTHSGYGFSSVPIKTSVNLNSLDIDGNGNPDALSDGLLILRSLFGLTDGALIQNVVATDATFSSASEIQSRINNLGEFLDIDGNAVVDPLSDGLLILRYMFGIRGADLINGVIAPDATRTTADQVEAYLAKMIPSI